MDNERYNGWTNYATSAVNLWLDNDEYTQSCVQEMVLNASNLETRRIDVADSLREFVADGMPELGASLYLDLLQSALDDVNWREIADHYIEAYADESEEAAA